MKTGTWIAWILVVILASVTLAEDEWKIVFYTGDAKWAGTDDQIYFRIQGDRGSTQTEYISSELSNFEAGSIDTFIIKNVDLNKMGRIKSIVVGKSVSTNSYSDWLLNRIELYQNTNEFTSKYTFYCNCWYRRSGPFFRTILLGPVDGKLPSESSESSNWGPIAAGVLFGIVFLIVAFGIGGFFVYRCQTTRQKKKSGPAEERQSLSASNVIQPNVPPQPPLLLQPPLLPPSSLARPYSDPPDYFTACCTDGAEPVQQQQEQL